MSKLYDQLRKAEAARDRQRRGIAEPASDILVETIAPRPVRARRAAPRLAPYARGMLLFASGAAVALIGVHLAPRVGAPPQAIEAPAPRPAQDAGALGLKLDYRLDLTRTGGAAR